MMLVVAVYGDNADTVGPVFQEPPEGGFQGSALAPVHFVVEKVNFRMIFGGIRKVVQVFRLTAIVHQDNVGKAIFQQAVNNGIELFVRVQGGQDHGEF